MDGANRASASIRRGFRILRQAVFELYPGHFLLHPDMFGWRECVAVIEYGKCYAGRRSVPPPGKQPRTAVFAENTVDGFRAGITAGVALHFDGALPKERASKKRRPHRLLAIAAMADADIDGLALRLEPD